MTLSPQIIAALLGLQRVSRDGWQRYNIAPTQSAPVVRNASDHKREVVDMVWGLIPSWSKDRRIGSRLINARSETAATKPSFRSAMKQRRCIVPASGFYEWQKIDARTKQPFYLQRADGEPLLLAGLWEQWRDPSNDESIKSFTVLTTAANEQVQQLHDRMPVILEPEDVDAWLDAPADDVEMYQAKLKPAAEGVLTMHPVSTRVNSPRNDDPSLIKPVDREASEAGEADEKGLFD